MKFALLVGDGMGDYPLAELGGLTPLEAAVTPHMDTLAREGTVGLVRTIPAGMPPGSDIANLNLLGYDVTKYYTGRAPLEAASRGIELPDTHIAFRCNLVTVLDNVMVDYSSDHIGSDEAAELVAALDAHFGSDIFSFYPGVSYRHLLVTAPPKGKRWDTDLQCTPPHDIVGRQIEEYLPRGDDENLFVEMMMDSIELLSAHPINRKRRDAGKHPANMMWLWGQGRPPSMPRFRELFGLHGAVISAVDLIRGIGKYAGFKVFEVPGITGYYDTNYSGKADYGLRSLAEHDFLFVHVEAPDEAGHAGDIREKIRAIENFDKFVVGPIVEGMKPMHPRRVMVLPDHFTPVEVGTHVSDPVPFLIWGTGVAAGDASAFTEAEGRRSEIMVENGFELLPPYLTV